MRAYTVVSAVRHRAGDERVCLAVFTGVVAGYLAAHDDLVGDVSYVEATDPAHAMRIVKEIPYAHD